jgi:urea ABC transporter ATP-binding protein UrtE
VLSLRDVWAGYKGAPILQGVDLRLERGEIVAVLGRNGVGKTTLLRAVMGLVDVTAGTIELAGEDLRPVPTHRRARLGLGYVPQGRQVFPRLSVRDNLLVGAWARDSDADARIERVLEEFPTLREKLGASGGGLSGGEQQLLALARTLAAEPSLLLLDEPSEGIQPSTVELIASKVQEISEQRGVTVLLVEQNLEFAAQLARRAYVLDRGRITRELAPGHILEDPTLQQEFVGG